MTLEYPGGLRAVPVSLQEGGGHREDVGLPALKMKMGGSRHKPGDGSGGWKSQRMDLILGPPEGIRLPVILEF